jgi:starch synthase
MPPAPPSPAAPSTADAPLRICHVAAECAPFAKRGGLGDVTAALTRYLAGAGHEVRTFLPLYGIVDRDALGVEPVAAPDGGGPLRCEVVLGGRAWDVGLWQAPLAPRDGVGKGHAEAPTGSPAAGPFFLVDCPPLFGGDRVYAGDDADPRRFAVFCRAVLALCRRLGWAPQVFHVHDWHAALLPLYARAIPFGELSAARVLLTLHNVGFQGVMDAGRLDEIGLAGHAGLFAAEDLAAGRLNLLRAAIRAADLLTTVSPTHAWEIQTPDGGAGLDDDLRQRSHRLVGILNGIDDAEWNPATDPHLAATYTADDLFGKLECRRALAEELELDYEPAAPTAGIVSRLTWQKGFELVEEPLPALLAASDLRLAVLGTGEERYERFFAELERSFPGRVAFRRTFSEPLAHRIEAGADLFLMPSRYEPCGLNQMYSQRYGTPPLVRRTGGLADTVRPYAGGDAGEAGTGFVFDHFTADGFRWALDLALATWRDRAAWRGLMRRGMAEDFSWQRRGGEYLELYRKLAAAGSAAG